MSRRIKHYRPMSPGQRFRVSLVGEPQGEKKFRTPRALKISLSRNPGRSLGRVTVRHKGGGHKKLYRVIDFRRDKLNLPARVAALEYDPNRNVEIALLYYLDGEKRFILCPESLKVGDVVESGEEVAPKVGNSLPLKNIPVGTLVHNLEINHFGPGGLVRSAGTAAQIMAYEDGGKLVQVKLPSGEVRRFHGFLYATVGQLANYSRRQVKLGKAGRSRHLGIRPTVRGVAQNPHSHPHGGGEGRSGIGMPTPKTPWGKIAMGKRTRRREKTNKYIISRRNQ
ncbi:MAG: 50S ribosomal protein L2 [Patescibacteria group bacterium]|nr:50S ribosomal protein L2 [Patescibacteria group bacterium]